ncbi:uncharacterized protein HKW66_Vig0141560 [Vigna angularis]|uniref:Epidermal patterning factor-like protein n=1 Tax=Phaseolus angularis TaxID=3914 RepID=A0A8T0KDX8_PHAAN|nr:EPIDERMAL PATTERNING FACTOR-like protein 5 isoform X2 [Vigna angularis]XP_052734284.1 EPIDERMAL PATTERNING FACTOR-like protein 5 isoform X2 [Vigna angularis]KAG2397608.1 uncharacterized protein HKW66_Vig0141560 [Vigna angularis]
MDTIGNQTRLCSIVMLMLLCTMIFFSCSAASTKASESEESLVSSTGRPKMLIGSSPPTCISRCDNCTPCKPIVVPFPPPVPLQTLSTSEQLNTAFQRSDDFGPQAVIWKCTCGGKLCTYNWNHSICFFMTERLYNFFPSGRGSDSSIISPPQTQVHEDILVNLH